MADNSTLTAGLMCTVQGLQVQTSLNGSSCKLIALVQGGSKTASSAATSERWNIKVMNGAQAGKTIAVKPRNLVATTQGIDMCPIADLCHDEKKLLNVIGNARPTTGWMPDQWFELPGMGSRIRLVRSGPGKEHVFYPFLAKRGLNLEFAGPPSWDMGTITLQRGDVLSWCPQYYVWVYCFFCQKFLFPPEDHRESKKHISNLQWLDMSGPDCARQCALLKTQRHPLMTSMFE